MELVYKDGQIVEVLIHQPALSKKLTTDEKMQFFTCEEPNQTVWQNVTWLEYNICDENGTPKTTFRDTVQSMVTEGLITQARADEILA